MVKAVYRAGVQYQQPASIAKFITLPKVFNWTPTLAIWGAAAGTAVFFFADSITRYRKDVLKNLPSIGPYYDDFIDPEDTPF